MSQLLARTVAAACRRHQSALHLIASASSPAASAGVTSAASASAGATHSQVAHFYACSSGRDAASLTAPAARCGCCPGGVHAHGRRALFSDSTSPPPPAGGGGGAAKPSEWFVTKNMTHDELWIAALKGKMGYWAKHATASGPAAASLAPAGQDALLHAVKEAFYELYRKHAESRVMDDRTRTQLRLACLAAATHRELSGVVGAGEVDRHIGESLGSLFAGMLTTTLKGSVWFKVKILGRDPMELAAQTVRDVASDMEGACSCEVGDTPTGGCQLSVASCLFNDVFAAEGVPHLVRFFCCHHNLTFLKAYEAHGVAASMPECRSEGDQRCVLAVERRQ